MPKLQWMKWVPADWIQDTRGLSLQAKGAWADLLNFMWNAPQRGQWEGTFEELSWLIGCTVQTAQEIVKELPKVASVTVSNISVTVQNRRMIKQEMHYKNNAIRQARYKSNAKSNASVTDKTTQESLRLLKTTPNNTSAFGDIWSQYPKKIGRTGAEKAYRGSVKTDVDVKNITIALENYKRYCVGKEQQYIKNGDTWFRSWRDWIDFREESNAPNGGKSLFSPTAIVRAKKEAEKLRATTSAGEISSGFGDLPNVSLKTDGNS